jgi:hypothetical protein
VIEAVIEIWGFASVFVLVVIAAIVLADKK